MPRPQLPPSDDPKVQAQREKAREYAKKKKEAAAKQEPSNPKINQELKKNIKEQKASSTINQAIKMKIARKKLAEAKGATQPPAKPAKKPDDNPFHNLPEDIQKKIMGMAKGGAYNFGWKKADFQIKGDDEDNPSRRGGDFRSGEYIRNYIKKGFDIQPQKIMAYQLYKVLELTGEPTIEKHRTYSETTKHYYYDVKTEWIDFKDASPVLKQYMSKSQDMLINKLKTIYDKYVVELPNIIKDKKEEKEKLKKQIEEGDYNFYTDKQGTKRDKEYTIEVNVEYIKKAPLYLKGFKEFLDTLKESLTTRAFVFLNKDGEPIKKIQPIQDIKQFQDIKPFVLHNFIETKSYKKLEKLAGVNRQYAKVSNELNHSSIPFSVDNSVFHYLTDKNKIKTGYT